jgi:organic hydroperoxide reductase OsmC/OhrA
VRGAGHVTRRADGRFGFVLVELAVEITTEQGFEEEARRTARSVESGCVITEALQVPVEVELIVRVAAPAVA